MKDDYQGALGPWKTLKRFSLPSAPGNERLAMEIVADALLSEGLSPQRMERIKTAVAEAALNAMEHGSGFREDAPVDILVEASEQQVRVCITDIGLGEIRTPQGAPKLEAKLDERESPRGWGLFLIQSMVDDLNILTEEQGHTIELLVYKTDPAENGTTG